MEFNERERRVLESIIDYYLNSGEAIGSRTLVKKYGMELSSATIRNVMSDLEDTGYIAKAHTSSGRSPTIKGYKYYIDKLLEIKKLNEDEMQKVQNAYEQRVNELEDVLEKTSELLSKMSHYAGVAFETNVNKDRVKKIELVHVNMHTIMAVVVTNGSSVKTKKMHLEFPISEEEVKEISKILNEELKEKNNPKVFECIQKKLNQSMENVYNEVIKICSKNNESEIYIDGTPKMIEDLSRDNPDEVVNVIKLLEEKAEVKQIFTQISEQYGHDKKVNIIFGEDLNIKGLEELSFIFSSYDLGDSKGIIGIIGPKRMEYSKTAGLVEYITEEVNRIINRIIERE